jgi:transposase
MLILALDLGSTSRKATKTYATVLNTDSGEIQRTSVPTTSVGLLELIGAYRPTRVVVEVTRGCGWVMDLCRGAGVEEIQAANPMDPAWRNRTSKTDRNDADLLARLSASGQLRTVHIPKREVREWRDLIGYRHRLVRERTRIKNHIRSILLTQGLPTGRLWNQDGLARLAELVKSMESCSVSELWRGELWIDLIRLREIGAHIATITKRLDALVASSEPAAELLAVDGVGGRCAEIITASIDDPLRFHNRKEIGAYFGLVPRVLQSGGSLRHGRITKAGDGLARAMLVEVVHLGIRRDGWMRDTYQRYLRDDPLRVKRALTATARRLVVRLWAKLRDHRRKHPTVSTISLAA